MMRFQKMEVTYIRFQDDLLILCKTKRQLNRCRRRMMEVLHERHLSLSRKKSRIGCIKKGFHFLGINYPPTRTEDNTSVTHANDDLIAQSGIAHDLTTRGGGRSSHHQKYEPVRIIPHPRTLRKAREQVKCMVIDEVSPRRIRNYLHRWVAWWVNASETWDDEELIKQFLEVCWDRNVAAYAVGLLIKCLKQSGNFATSDLTRVGRDIVAAAA